MPATRRFTAKLAILFVWLVVCVAAAAPPNQVSLRWVQESPETNRAFVEVVGLVPSALKQLRQADWKLAQWQRLLAVRAEQGDLIADIGLPPMLGIYRVTANTLRFDRRRLSRNAATGSVTR
jgi:hypothetical protein